MESKATHYSDDIGYTFYDYNLGAFYLSFGNNEMHVCNVKKNIPKMRKCSKFDDDVDSNIFSLVPLYGYNSESYPFLLLRGSKLHIVDTKTLSVKRISQQNIAFAASETHYDRIVDNLIVQSDRFVTFGRYNDQDKNYPLIKLEMTAEFIPKLEGLYT